MKKEMSDVFPSFAKSTKKEVKKIGEKEDDLPF